MHNVAIQQQNAKKRDGTFIRRLKRRKVELAYMIRTGAPLDAVTAYVRTASMNSEIERDAAAVKRDFLAFTEGQSFSTDWFSHNIGSWHFAFRTVFERDAELEALEIGSWEGMSSSFMLFYFPNLRLSCVDTWAGADEHRSDDSDMAMVEQRFDANVSQNRERISKNKFNSATFLLEHCNEKSYDLIYIDGSHHSDDVLLDAILSFSKLKIGGIIIFDDYLWRQYKDIKENPANAINAFLRLKKDNYRIISLNYQIIIQKTRAEDRLIV